MMKIGLISDVHAAPAPLEEALELFHKQNVDTVLCAGDIAGYGQDLERTVDLLIGNNCQCIVGNHDVWYLESSGSLHPGTAESFLRELPLCFDMFIEGCELSMVHASPSGKLLDGIRLLDEQGRPIKKQLDHWSDKLNSHHADILVVGHTHQVYTRQLGGLLVINPGSSVFNHTCAILTLPGCHVDFYPLSGKEPVLSWNFNMFRQMSW